MFLSKKILLSMFLLGSITSVYTKYSGHLDVTTASPAEPGHVEVSTGSLAQESCGDTGESEVWWPVFINNGELDKIQQAFCRNAISTKRMDGTPSIQLASFKTREEAQAFAAQVHGEVGSPSYVYKKNTEQATESQDSNSLTNITGNTLESEDSSNSTDAIENTLESQESDTAYQYPSSPPVIYQSPSPLPEPYIDGNLVDKDSSSGECRTYANGCND